MDDPLRAAVRDAFRGDIEPPSPGLRTRVVEAVTTRKLDRRDRPDRGHSPLAQLALTALLILFVLILQVAANEMRATRTHTPAAGSSLIGSWSSAGSMAEGRVWATATLMSNGSVLITGGQSRVNGTRGSLSSPLGTTEVYDPATNSWSAGAAMPIARTRQAGLLLSDGRLLVIGGYGPQEPLARADIYDPTSRRWSPAGTLAIPRVGFSATLLSDGRVLVAGGGAIPTGNLSYYPALASTEIYDPRGNSWSIAASMLTPRVGHSATPLADGKVLVVGGSSGRRGEELATSELYDPRTNSWSVGPAMNIEREGHVAVLLKNGDVLVVGGSQGGIQVTDPEVYQVRGDRWVAMGGLPEAGTGFAVTPLADGRVLLVGGIGGGRHALLGKFGVLYDPRTNSWSAIVPPVTARMYPTAILLLNGKVLITGGLGDQGGTVTEADLFDPAGQRAAGSPARPRQLPLPWSTLVLAGIAGVLAIAVGAASLWRRRAL
jgi:N-acetylneuraminic acid mutarotase